MVRVLRKPGEARRKPGAARRAEIADAALRLAGERGLTALTAGSLAGAVGVTSGALFRHFPSCDAILTESVRRAVERVDTTFPPPGGAPVDRLLALVRARVALLRRDPGVAWLLRSDEALLALPSPAVEALRDLVGRSRAFLRESVEAGQADGSIRRDVAAAALLPVVTGTLHALAGPPGVHRLAAPARPHDLEPALAALRTLLSPAAPRGPRPARSPGKRGAP